MKPVVHMVFGSKLYGLEHENSDTDYAGVFIPDSRDIILGTTKDIITTNTNGNDKNTKFDVDNTQYSLKKFILTACNGDLRAMDMLHAPKDKIIISSNEWEFIQDNRSKFYSTNVTAFKGFFKTKVRQYTHVSCMKKIVEALEHIDDYCTPEQKMMALRGEFQTPHLFKGGYVCNLTKIGMCQDVLPTFDKMVCFIEETSDSNIPSTYYVLGKHYPLDYNIRSLRKQLINDIERADGSEYNYKEVSQVLRVGYQLLDIFNKGDMIYPLKQTDSIMACKLGKRSISDVEDELQQLYNDVMKAREIALKNGMPEQADRKFWEEFVFDTYCVQVYAQNLCF